MSVESPTDAAIIQCKTNLTILLKIQITKKLGPITPYDIETKLGRSAGRGRQRGERREEGKKGKAGIDVALALEKNF